jgi:hypothetical protein
MTGEAPPPEVASPEPTAASVSATAPQQIAVAAPPTPEPTQPDPPLADLNHFYPRDPTLRPGLQQPRHTNPPPDEEELRWRELSRRHAPSSRRRY